MGEDDDHDGPSFRHGHHYHNFNSNIMIAAIAALSFVIILVIALHIYARCVLRRHVRRRSAVRDLGVAVVNARSSEQPQTGLDPSVIASLPLFQFKKNSDADQEQGDNAATECAVCLSVLDDGDMARSLPNCKHTFHAECIDMWFNQHATCPICRTEAEPRPLPEPRETPAGVAPTAPPLERINSSFACMEGTSDMGCSVLQSGKIGGSSSSRLSSFRRMLTRERSSRRIPVDHGDIVQDLERQ